MRISLGFARTTCACEKCTIACVHKPGLLLPEDLPRIAERLGYGQYYERFARECLLASKGWVLGNSLMPGSFTRVPTLVPRKEAHGCIFLQSGRCTIHEVSPFGCAFFDMHQSKEEGDKRSMAAVKVVQQAWIDDDLYARLHRMLEAEGRVAEDPKITHPKLMAAVDAIETRDFRRRRNKERDKKRAERKKKSR